MDFLNIINSHRLRFTPTYLSRWDGDLLQVPASPGGGQGTKTTGKCTDDKQDEVVRGRPLKMTQSHESHLYLTLLKTEN